MSTARLAPIVVMGVSGVGKSTVGTELARRLGVEFVDGDDLHPASNIAKMASGRPLDDDDRAPWLDAVADRLCVSSTGGPRGVVVACSALRRIYRDRIRGGCPGVVFVHLTDDREVIAGRLASRPGHFMPASLLDSQLDALEPPAPEERAITVVTSGDTETTVDIVISALQRTGTWT